MPTVSCILPTYNSAKNEEWLRQSIQSVIDQTYTDWELIIVNDCSTDNTLDILNEYARKDKRIKVVSNEVNSKLPATLNHGFELATGEYWTWTSDDNYYKPNAFEKMLDFLKKENADFVAFNQDVENGKKYLKNYYTEHCKVWLLQKAMLCGFGNIGGAFLYKASLAKKVGPYNTDYFVAEDFEFFVRCALNGKISYSKESVYVYRQQENSLSATKKIEQSIQVNRVKLNYALQWFEHFNFSEKDKQIFIMDTINKGHIYNSRVFAINDCKKKIQKHYKYRYFIKQDIKEYQLHAEKKYLSKWFYSFLFDKRGHLTTLDGDDWWKEKKKK